MREIKFRAWSGNKMYDWEHISVNGGLNHWIEDLGANIMEYTGLKDQNGREIYEGDIIWDTWYSEAEKWSQYEIVFADGFFNLKDLKYKQNSVGIWNVHNHCKIIGNIYQSNQMLLYGVTSKPV